MAKSFKYKDDNYLDSTGIVHNKELLSYVLEEISNKDIIKVGLTSAVTMTAGEYTKIPFNIANDWRNHRSSFTFDKNGSITINSPNVKRVNVNVSALNSAWGQKSFYLTINKNGSVVKNSYILNQSYIQNQTEILVEEGDVITATFYCAEAINLSNNKVYTQMTVSVG